MAIELTKLLQHFSNRGKVTVELASLFLSFGA
jgi:hypothetical protein